MRTVWFLAIMLRIAVFRKTKLRDFGWYLAFCIIAEMSLFAMNWFRWSSGHVYDLTWRVTQCISLLGLAAVTWEAVECSLVQDRRGWFYDTDHTERGSECRVSQSIPAKKETPNRNPENSQEEGTGRVRGRPHGTGRSRKVSVLCSLVLTIIAVFGLHHASRWPAFWLEPIFTAICAANLFFGMVIISARRWTPHGAILCEWLMFNGILYSGAAISPREVGLAGEILNCITFAAWSFV